jgi:hypothetical protein
VAPKWPPKKPRLRPDRRTTRSFAINLFLGN